MSQPVARCAQARFAPPARRRASIVTSRGWRRSTLADAAAIAATHDTGQLALQRSQRELPAIEALERDVIDPSHEQSATAVLDKISGAVLIGARQRQAAAQLLPASSSSCSWTASAPATPKRQR